MKTFYAMFSLIIFLTIAASVSAKNGQWLFTVPLMLAAVVITYLLFAHVEGMTNREDTNERND